MILQYNLNKSVHICNYEVKYNKKTFYSITGNAVRKLELKIKNVSDREEKYVNCQKFRF